MLESLNVKGKKIIITGAAGILGSVYAGGFSEQGADVAMVDLDEMQCREKAAEMRKKCGPRPLGMGCDITSPEAVKTMVRQVMAEYGSIDALGNNAAAR